MTGTGDTVDFTYNADGLRVRKESTVRGVTEYTLSGKQITHLTRKENGQLLTDMHFWYDAQGKPAMVSYNGNDYVYVYNAQGDVVALLDKANHHIQVVAYAYDPWGKQVACTGTMANTLGVENPFRYRGYMFDVETGLYYLRSRYYNPDWGRFVNADALLGKTGALLSHNAFAYCLNNPMGMTDTSGREAWWANFPLSDVKSLGWRDIFINHYGFEPGTTTKRSELLKSGSAVVIDMLSGESFEMTFSQICDDGYHIDGNFVDKSAGIETFGRLLNEKYTNSNYKALYDAGLKVGRPAIIIFDNVMSFGSLVPFLHKNSGDFTTDGHFDVYVSDSVSSHTPNYPLSNFTIQRRNTAKFAPIMAKWLPYAQYDSTTNGKYK